MRCVCRLLVLLKLMMKRRDKDGEARKAREAALMRESSNYRNGNGFAQRGNIKIEGTEKEMNI